MPNNALRLKSKKRLMPPSTDRQADSIVRTLGPVILLIGVASLANVASQLALYPLYGTTVSSMHFATVSLAICMLSSFIPFPVSLEGVAWTALSIIIPASPTLLYTVGAQTASWNDPVWGPITTQIVSSIPGQFLANSIVISRIAPHLDGILPSFCIRPMLGFASWFAFVRADQAWWDYLYLRGISSCNLYVFVTLGASLPTAVLSIPDNARFVPRPSSVLSWLQTTPAGSVALHLAVPFIISLIAQNRSPCSTPLFPYLAANNTLRVLDRQQSTTGLIVVAENLAGPFRFLRCDHSLLGGRWLYAPGRDQPAILDESIFSAFALQEAVRLVDRPTTRSSQRVLNIGLGIGVSVESFIRHKMHTTVVEIDPVVYRFARQYFDLPKPSEVHIDDARSWVRNHAAKIITGAGTGTSSNKFDFVVHDCFSGGGVPQHIFTSEFWADLQIIMKPDGVLAVNFVGRLTSNAARSVLVTLLSSFRLCRAFHDHYPPEDGLKEDRLLNMVFFCTSMENLSFRPATEPDFLGTQSRQYILGQLQDHEVDLELILGNITTAESGQLVLTDAKNDLNELQKKGAIEHFSVMQSVLPQPIWNTY